MKVLLVKPYNLSDHIQPSLGLGYLASSIKDKHEVRILDCIKEKVRLAQFPCYLEEYNPDILGIQCYTHDLKFVREALRMAKDINPKVVTIVGGPHPSSASEETMRYFSKDLDYGFAGEAEKGFSMLLDKFVNHNAIGFEEIPGLIWHKSGEKIKINERMFVENLDELGFPAWDLIRPNTYPESQHGAFYRKFPIAPIILTRGCPFRCTFCAGNNISGRKIRTRSVNNILSEIALLYNDYGIREFHIIDDNFSMRRDFTKSFLDGLINLNLNISWATPNGLRMDTLDEELLDLMKKSGLYLISLGIESGSDRILNLMKKGITTEKIRRYVALIKKSGIDIAGFFILGFPGENRQDMEETIRFSLELDLIRANFFTFLPFPGTESYQELARNDGLEQIDWERFRFMNAAYVPQGMTRKELKWLQRKAFLKFFLRPRIFLRNIFEIHSLRHLYFLLRRAFNWLFI